MALPRAVKVDDEVHAELVVRVGVLQAATGRPTSINDVLRRILELPAAGSLAAARRRGRAQAPMVEGAEVK